MKDKRALGKGCWICLWGLLLWGSATAAVEKYDVIIKGGTIVDGTGKPGYVGDLAIRGDRIVALGKVSGDAPQVIDARGLIVCPGFVDTHAHADRNIVQYPLAENFLMQGITLFLAGNCGGTPAPAKNLSFGDWLSSVEKTPISINMATLVGTRVIRSLVMGTDTLRPATAEEIERMKPYVDEAMRSGAFGISSWQDNGVATEHASIEEIVALAKVAQKYGGIFSPHTANHDNSWWTDKPGEYGYGVYHEPPGEVIVGRYHGLLEASEISLKANRIPVLIAHFTPSYTIGEPHPDYVWEAIAKATLEETIDKPRARGVKIFFNHVASPYSINRLQPMIESFFSKRLATPDWLKNMSPEDFVANLKSREFREKVKHVVMYSGAFKFGMVHVQLEPYWMDDYRILVCKNKAYEGKILGEIVRQRCPDHIKKAVYDESMETVFDILSEDPDTKWALIADERESPGASRVFFKSPYGMPCLDVGSMPAVPEEGSSPAGPVAYGGYARYLDTHVKKEHSLTLEEAINRASYVGAHDLLGLKDRGVLSPQAYADIVVFSLDKIRMAGDFLKPNVPPDGIVCVFVNGKVVYKDKKHTGEKPGKVIRHAF
jgi:N-acyl-D-amino-acid deacylase